MEKLVITSVASRKNETRSLFKKCFKNPLFSLVPFEIWRDFIVLNTDLKTFAVLCQTCNAFKELANDIGEKNLNLAFMFRREGQIGLALKFLLKCASNNNPKAMFHVGFSHFSCGWGISRSDEKAKEWFKKSAELGNGARMAYYAFSLSSSSKGFYNDEDAQCNAWAKKAMSSNDPFAVGFCHQLGLGTVRNAKLSSSFYEAAADEGDEFGQSFLASFLFSGEGIEMNVEKALDWWAKAAIQGLCIAQFRIGDTYCKMVDEAREANKEKIIFWYKKAAKQGHPECKQAVEKDFANLRFKKK